MNNKGFTLLEVLMAVIIFAIGIVSAMTLAFSDLNKTKNNYNKIRAAHLAREGVELIRNIRDSNWLKYQANVDCSAAAGLQYCNFDEDLNYNFVSIDYSTNTPNVICSGFTFDNCLSNEKNINTSNNVCLNNQTCDLFQIDNLYKHDLTTTTLSTNLARAIQIRSICRNGDGLEYFEFGTSDCAPEEKIGIEVTSRVRWEEPSGVDFIDVQAYLYDWRY